jgi:hypothetical protein
MCPAEDDDITSHQNEDLVALPHVAREAGVSARVLRYWAEQGLISPTGSTASSGTRRTTSRSPGW